MTTTLSRRIPPSLWRPCVYTVETSSYESQLAWLACMTDHYNDVTHDLRAWRVCEKTHRLADD
jgi:hypothetical protein